MSTPIFNTLAQDIARYAYGFYNGDGSGTNGALAYWDGVGKDLPGPKFTVEVINDKIAQDPVVGAISVLVETMKAVHYSRVGDELANALIDKILAEEKLAEALKKLAGQH
jgi:hypothetical protein